MKVNELRVGSWVYDDEGVCSKIVGVKPFDDSVGCNELEDGSVLVDWYPQGQSPSREYFMDVSDLKPISLSEEILLKCGFVRRGFSINGYVFAKSLAYHVTKMLDYYAFRINTLSCNNVFIREVRYLHELQNLYFAITGEELEVKL